MAIEMFQPFDRNYDVKLVEIWTILIHTYRQDVKWTRWIQWLKLQECEHQRHK